MNKILAAFAAVVFCISTGMAQSAPPRIFYSDLTSGSNAGGQNNAGAFVTVYGNGFGNTRGISTVTVGGGKAANYPIWSNTKVTFQLGAAAKSGNIVVNLPGAASNSVPFTVSAGKIYFVSRSGSATNSGTYASPWLSLRSAKNKMMAGDIVYVEDGVAVTNTESNDASLVLSNGGTAAAPKAIITYPGSTVTIGSSTGAKTGIQVTSEHWVLSGLTIRGAQSGITLSDATGTRVSSSDITCPNGNGTGACVNTSASSDVAFLGNYVHDNGAASNASAGSYHSMLFTGSNSTEVGWNQIGNTRGCNALMFNTDGAATHTLSIHDNYIHDARCEAISLGVVDPSQGAVNLYNNVIAKSGTGPAAEGMATGGGYAAIAVEGGSSTPVQAYNNTIYQAGAIGGADAGAVRASSALELTNNIIYLASGQQYVSLDTDLSWVSGSKNVFYGAGNPPGVFADSMTADPQLASPSTGDFHPLAGSPAINAGAATAVTTDLDGVLTPQSSTFTIGAYEFSPKRTQSGTLTATPATIAFGSVNVGQSGTATTVISNTGLKAVSISAANSNNSQFNVSGMSFPLSLNPGKSATLTVTYTPTAAGAQSGSVSLASNASNSPLNITVGGTGVAAGAPGASLSTTALTFASQVVNTASAAQNVTLTNNGSASLTISLIAATGDFAEQSTCGATLAANSSCSISVTFTPTATGARSGTLTITDNASSKTQQVALSGMATAATTPATLQASTSTLSMGSVAAGSSVTQSLTITNTGTASATISALTSSNYALFSTSGLTAPVTIAGGGSVTLTAVFTPTHASYFIGTLTIQSNASNPTMTINWSGTGTTGAAPTATLQASSTSLSMASVAVGSSSTQSVTITNTGTASATISGITSSNAAFSTSGVTAPVTIAGGGSVTLTVVFSPTSASSVSGTLTIQSTATNPTLSINVTGTGTTTAASHSVSLSWSDSSTVAGYNVYRSTQSGSGYGKLTSSLNAPTSYTDTTVSAGLTYYYVVTAVDASGNESAYSSQVTASVPTP